MSNSPLKRSGMARVNEGSHNFTRHPRVYPQVEWTMPAFTPQPQSRDRIDDDSCSRPARSFIHYIKRGKVSVRTYIRSYVRNGGRGQFSSEWRHNENDVIMRTGAASAIMRMTSQWQ